MESNDFGDDLEKQEQEAADKRTETEKGFKALIAEKGLDQALIAAAGEVSKKIVEENVKPAGAEGEGFFRNNDADALFQSFVKVAECTDPDFAIKFTIDEAIKSGHARNGYDIARVRLALHGLLLRKMMKSV